MSGTATVPVAKLALAARRARDGSDVIGADPIAIVGMGCRFPGGAASPAAFWRLLATGVDSIGEVPPSRWNAKRYDSADPSSARCTNSRWGSFLEDIRGFDAAFFGIAAHEAETLDPQQRLLLEVACEALDDAGQTAERLRGSQTGVFVAIYNTDYLQALHADPDSIGAYSTSGTVPCMASGRLSYHFDLRGPSMVIDTACSSSLVAVHQACESLRARTSDLAVAGAVSLVLAPDRTLSLARWGFMAPDGRCKPFDAAANGWVRGEGCGAVVLRRLSDALAAGDRVWAVIRGTAITQDGRSAVLTAPNGAAQTAVIRGALANGRVAPEDIGYIEAHGTGTVVGDPIEFEALVEALGNSPAAVPCAIGAVKANIGHLEAAAGIAGLIKSVLVLAHGRIPPQLHFSRLNPLLSFDGTRLSIAAAGKDWSAGGRRRFAGVSAFGFSGTNAHVVLEEPPLVPTPVASEPPAYVLFLSARSDTSLQHAARAFADALDVGGDLAGAAIRDVCFTAGARRHPHEHRLSVAGTSRVDVVSGLRGWLAGVRAWTCASGVVHGPPSQVAFVFSGQGSQWVGMGRTLLNAEPVARRAFDECATAVRDLGGPALLEELWRDDSETRLSSTSIVQPALFAIQIALAAQLRSWGIVPTAVVGHSVGEIAAAHASGALSLTDAVRVVLARSRAMEAVAGRGRMLAVAMDRDAALEHIRRYTGRLSLAAINDDSAVVISGDVDAIEASRETFESSGVRCRVLDVPYAFHSHQMEEPCAALSASLRSLRPAVTSVAFASTVTGGFLAGESLDGDYWQQNATAPVEFRSAIDALVARGHHCFLEVGPHPVLAAHIATATAELASSIVVPTLHRQRDDPIALRAAAGALHTRGVAVDAAALLPRGQVVSLPAYQWDRQDYWAAEFDAARERAERSDPLGPRREPLRLREVEMPWSERRVFTTTIAAAAPSWIADHRIAGDVLCPAAVWLSLADAAGRRVFGIAPAIEDVFIHRPLLIDAEVTVQIGVAPHGTEEATFEIWSQRLQPTQNWTKHVSGTIRTNDNTAAQRPLPASSDSVAPAPRSISSFYDSLADAGMAFGPAFRTIRSIAVSGDLVHATVEASPDAGVDDFADLHPTALDGCLQAAWAAVGVSTTSPMVPVAIGRIRTRGPASPSLTVTVRATPAGDRRGWQADVTARSGSGHPVVEIERLILQPYSRRDDLAGAGGVAIERIVWRDLSAVETPTEAAAWLILADRGGLGDRLAAHLSESGHACRVVHATRDIDAFVGCTDRPHRIVCLWPLDAAPVGFAARELAANAGRDIVEGALQLLQAVAARPGVVSDLAFVTRTGQAVDNEIDPLQSLLWGLGRNVDVELPEIVCRRLDLPAVAPEDAAFLVDGLLRPSDERELAYRNGRWRAPRLTALADGASFGDPVALEVGSRGSIETLRLSRRPQVSLQSNEIRIQVAASGLNFRDVLNALGLYPGDAGPLGSECVGEIVATGADVRDLEVGDSVVALGNECLATFATTTAHLVVKRPPALSNIEAATVPIAFLTADYALFDCARLKPGDRVLLHAAAGGVGLAAVQLAISAGAEVYATASSDEKREYVKALGAIHVASSRDLGFDAEIRQATGGRGIDVVLNSLTGEFIPRSVDLLAPGGRFVEIGKRDVWSGQQMQTRRSDVAYSIFQLGDELQRAPEHVGERLRQLLDRCGRGELRPLPVHQFPLSQSEQAFRFMARGRHIGKVVLTTPALPPWAMRSDGAYLVTGGGGALGTHAARWLAARGARHIVLAGRSIAEDSPEFDDLRKATTVDVERCDVTSTDQVRRLVATFGVGRPPLRGVIHTAGERFDGVLVRQDWTAFHAGLETKVAGTWNLHSAMRRLPLDFFVCYSSIAGTVGSTGQASYCAANAFVDAVAHLRRAQGLPALSLAWGAWDVGMAADIGERDQARWRADGVTPITAAEGNAVLDRIRALNVPDVTAVSMDWRRYAAQHPVRRALLADAIGGAGRVAREPATAASPGPRLIGSLVTLRPREREEALQRHLRRKIAALVGRPADREIDEHIGFRELGLDSLLAIELRNGIQTDLGVVLPATLAFDFPTLATLSAFLLSTLGPLDHEPSPTAAVERPAGNNGDQAGACVPDEEALRLLERELTSLEQEMGRRTP